MDPISSELRLISKYFFSSEVSPRDAARKAQGEKWSCYLEFLDTKEIKVIGNRACAVSSSAGHQQSRLRSVS